MSKDFLKSQEKAQEFLKQVRWVKEDNVEKVENDWFTTEVNREVADLPPGFTDLDINHEY